MNWSPSYFGELACNLESQSRDRLKGGLLVCDYFHAVGMIFNLEFKFLFNFVSFNPFFTIIPPNS